MKRFPLFGLFTLLVVLFSCNNKGADNAANTANDNSQQLLEGNTAVTHALETGNVDTLRKYIATDAVDHGGGPNGADLKGEDVIKQLASIHNDVDNMKMEIVQQAANDNYIFALVHMTGTTNKAVWGMPAKFKIDNKSVDVIRVENLKMKDHWSYMDPAEMMKMMPPPQGAATASQPSTNNASK